MATYDLASNVTATMAVCITGGGDVKIKLGNVTKAAARTGNTINPLVFDFQPSGGDGTMQDNFTSPDGLGNCDCAITVAGTVVDTNYVQLSVSGSCTNCRYDTTYDPGLFGPIAVDFYLDGNESCTL